MIEKNAAGIEANSIITPQIPRSAVVQCTVANTAYNPPTVNLVQLLQAGPKGGRLTLLEAIPAANVSATQLQLFRENGGVKRFTKSKRMEAQSMSQTAEAVSTPFPYSDTTPLQLGPNEILWVAIGVAGVINFVAEWADYGS